tara:strand:+ start:2925 stop:3752 length:828 start_codon:yes stop_codon:yes gene_type:complete
MKVQLTESQYLLLLEFQKRAYSFDWDDNILNMPTKIHLEKRVGMDDWIPVDASTAEFADLRHELGKGFRFLNDNPDDAFKDFKEHQSFLNDTEKALRKGDYGPSFEKFKEALIYGNDFSIITARGNSPMTLRDATKLLIDKHFTEEERQTMMGNLKGVTIDQYLNLQDYHPVSSEEFGERFGIEVAGGAANPERAKTIALEDFVRRVVQSAKQLQGDDGYEGLSVGFSDDDLGNVIKAEEFIRAELHKAYPNIKFLVYDTSDPKDTKKKRIIIKK